MKAVVYEGPFDVRVEEVDDPRIEAPTDALVRDLIVAGRARPSLIVSNELPLDAAPDAYEKFDRRVEGYTKVLLHPAMAA